MKSPLLLLSSLLQDCARLDNSVKGLDRDFVTIQHRFEHEGFSFLAVTLPALCDAVDIGISTGRFACPTAFKKRRKEALPVFLQGLLCKVFTLEGTLRPESSSYHVKMIRELLRVFKKAKLTQSAYEKLERKAIQSFEKTDEELADFPIGLFIPQLLKRVSEYVLLDLDEVMEDEIAPKHGPGAVFEGHKANQKWRALTSELLAGDFDPLGTPLDIFYANHAEDCGNRTTQASSRVARLVTVPKTSQSVRTITVEPFANQFGQQGLNMQLRRCIEQCSVLKHCLALNSQERNQDLAREGSVTDEWSTIDLSSASDLLDNRLVSLVFDSKPIFLERLQRFRTPFVSMGNYSLKLRKFAGMGNATTFPVQSVTFAVLGICSILEHKGISKPKHKDVVAAARQIQVFGDDIIIRRRFANTLSSWLTLFKLKLNESKSFLSGNFKESCGLDAFKGDCVTPVYIRLWPEGRSITDEALPGLVATSNLLWERGLYSASDTIRKMVSKCFRIPLVTPESGAIGWNDRYGSTEVHSWDPLLHHFLVRGHRVVPTKCRDQLDGHSALLKFFMTSLLERREGHLSRSATRYNTRVVRTWVPA